jgi:hypothetical protein
MNPGDELKLAWKYGLPAASVLAVLVYGLLRQLYATFYGRLGASPEEVGLGYQPVLALSGLAILLLVFATAVSLLVRWPILGVEHARKRAGASAAGALLSALLILAVAWWLNDRAARDGDAAFRGVPVHSVNIGPVQVLGLRAEPALVQWSDKPPAGLDTVSGHCLMYLGAADGVDVFFDPGPGPTRTIRLQAHAITVTVFRTIARAGHGVDAVCSGGTIVPRSS